MADQSGRHLFPADLDARSPDFHQRWDSWALQMQHDTTDIIVATKKTIASSRTLLADLDRIFPESQVASVGRKVDRLR